MVVFACAAAAHTAQANVLGDEGRNVGQLEDLVTNRFVWVGQHKGPTGGTFIGRRAENLGLGLFRGRHGAKAAFVARLCAQAFAAFGGGTLGVVYRGRRC